MPVTEVRAFRDASGNVPVQGWLDDLEESQPKAYAKCLARILELSEKGNEMRRPHADMLRDGIRELRASHSGTHYRILYFFFGKNVVVLSHGLVKEAQVPSREIDLAIANMNLVLKNSERHTADFEIG